MTRRRSSAPGRSRPDRRRSFLVLAAVLALVLSACGGSSASSPPATASSSAASSDAGSSPTATSSAGAATDEPSATPSDSAEPTETPSDAPSDEPSTEPSPSGTGAADACTGTSQNQAFYATVASAADWSVYCPALPAGWFVQTGSYRKAGGARLDISYRGPGGAHIELKEGAFCASSDGCVPAGTDSGTAAFGDREGSLVAVGDGSWAISVDAGKTPSWLLTGTGLAEEAFRTIAADLVIVGS